MEDYKENTYSNTENYSFLKEARLGDLVELLLEEETCEEDKFRQSIAGYLTGMCFDFEEHDYSIEISITSPINCSSEDPHKQRPIQKYLKEVMFYRILTKQKTI